jgi:hypothetical protein
MLENKLSKKEIAEELNKMQPVLLSRFPPKNKKGLSIDEFHEQELPNVCHLMP